MREIIIIGVIEFFFFLIILIFIVVFITKRYVSKKVVGKRIHVLFELSKKFYTQKNVSIIASDLIKMIVNSVGVFRFAGVFLIDVDRKTTSVQMYDSIYGNQEGVQFSDVLVEKIMDSKHYVVIPIADVKLNNYISSLPLISYDYLHVIKFQTGTDVQGAFFFGSDAEVLDDSEYEFLRTTIDHFSFGVRSKRLVKQVDRFTKTITLLEHTYQEIVDNLPVGVVVTDSKQNIVLWNSLMSSMFEKKEIDVSGKPISSIFKNKQNHKLVLDLIEKAQSHNQICDIELFRTSDGVRDKKVFLVICYPLQDSSIDFGGTLLVFRDITERVEFEAKLKKAQELKEKELQKKIASATKELVDANIQLKNLNALKTEFVSVVSHELRTPLTSIRGYVSLLLTEKLGALKHDQKQSLKVVKIESERLSHLINDLLDLSRLESGKTVLNFQKKSLDSSLAEVVASLKIKAKSKKIKLTKKILAKPVFFFDSEKIKQVLYNIAGNAIKFTSEGGSVKISIDEDKNYAYISIADTGIGIPKDKINKLFEPFFQIEGHLKRSSPGTGLGLTISKHIVELHHGQILVESTLKKGSTFIIKIPKHLQ
jgi:PAS domain S-box-containing protein